MRTFLRAVAAGAAGWAVAVSGVEDNPQFAIFLGGVAIALFVIAKQYGRVRRLADRWRWVFWAALTVLCAASITGGCYLAVHYRAPDSSAIDGEARRQVEQARQQVADLNAKVAALEAQVQTAIRFEADAKAAREKEAARQQRIARTRERLGVVSSKGDELRRACRTVEPTQYMLMFGLWHRSAIDALKDDGFSDEAGRMERAQLPPGIRVPPPNCDPHPTNSRVALGITGLLFLVGDISKNLGR